MIDQRRSLIVGLATESERFHTLLEDLGDEVAFAADADQAQALTDDSCYDLIVVEHPTPGRATRELLRSFRWSGSKSLEAVVVLVTTPDQLDEAEDLHEDGVTRILNVNAKDEILKIALHEVTRSEIRHPVKAVVRIPGSDLGQQGTIIAQTTNVSTTGMLIRLTKDVLVGARFTFNLQIPKLPQPINGAAEVVRINQGPGDRVTGFAAAFTEFQGSDGDKLTTFILAQPAATPGA